MAGRIISMTFWLAPSMLALTVLISTAAGHSIQNRLLLLSSTYTLYLQVCG